MWDLSPRPGIEPEPPAVEVRSLNHWTSREVPTISILFFKNFIYLFIWLRWVFVAVRGLFSGCGEWELLFVALRRLLIAVASLVAEHGL